jgi:hypothetical protein
MSDKVITLRTAQAQRSRDQDGRLINARLQWMADLVCAILNAENSKSPAATVKKPPVS